jgi:formate hydrogenlyase subunit 3/multisubunit Na+/H+ antiporter MnhD subunit
MTLPPTIPIAFLILGALAVGASTLARLNRPSLVMAIATIAALLAAAMLRSFDAISQIVSSWLPISVFGVPVSFRVDQSAWIIGLSLTLAGVATAFTWFAYPGQYRPAPRALSLLLIASAVASVFASNLLTLALAWGVLDVVFTISLLVRSGPEIGRRAALAIVLNTASTLCVWIAALLIENGHDSLYWHLLNLPSGAQNWLAAAAVLRVGLYPFHQWLPVELGQEPDRAVLLFVVPSSVGLALWARLAIANILPVQSIVPWLAVLSALVGAFLAWREPQARRGLPFIALSLAGLSIINIATASRQGTLTAATLNWLFITLSLFISRGLDRKAVWWSAGAAIAALSLIGLPGTLGFIVRQQTIAGLIAAGDWPLLIVTLIAETILVATLTRLIFTPTSEEAPHGWLRQIGFGLAIVCAAAPLIVLAVEPTLVPSVPSMQQALSGLSLISWIAFVLPVAAGVIVAQRDHRTTSDESDLPAWTNWLRLDWLAALAALPINWLGRVLRGLADIFEGEGGLVWALVIIVVAIVLYSGAIK